MSAANIKENSLKSENNTLRAQVNALRDQLQASNELCGRLTTRNERSRRSGSTPQKQNVPNPPPGVSLMWTCDVSEIRKSAHSLSEHLNALKTEKCLVQRTFQDLADSVDFLYSNFGIKDVDYILVTHLQHLREAVDKLSETVQAYPSPGAYTALKREVAKLDGISRQNAELAKEVRSLRENTKGETFVSAMRSENTSLREEINRLTSVVDALSSSSNEQAKEGAQSAVALLLEERKKSNELQSEAATVVERLRGEVRQLATENSQLKRRLGLVAPRYSDSEVQEHVDAVKKQLIELGAVEDASSRDVAEEAQCVVDSFRAFLKETVGRDLASADAISSLRAHVVHLSHIAKDVQSLGQLISGTSCDAADSIRLIHGMLQKSPTRVRAMPLATLEHGELDSEADTSEARKSSSSCREDAHTIVRAISDLVHRLTGMQLTSPQALVSFEQQVLMLRERAHTLASREDNLMAELRDACDRLHRLESQCIEASQMESRLRVAIEDLQAKVTHEAFLKESALELNEQLKDDFDASVARWGRELNELREVNATLRISLERARQEALDLSHREGNASIDVAMRETVADGLMESLHSVRKELHALGETMAETQKERDAAVNRCGTLE
eukprot:PhM_4_TR14669/c0_g1_i2/m.35557